MIYKWFSVALQEMPQTDKPWIVLENVFSEFNGTHNFKIHSSWSTREEADEALSLVEFE